VNGLTNQAAAVFGVAVCAVAVGMLRYSRRSETDHRSLCSFVGWFALLPALILLWWSLGLTVGAVTLVLAFSLIGYLAVLLGAERRAARTRSPRVSEPEVRPHIRWRGWVRGLAAFFLALISSIAIGSACAGMPFGAPADRLSIGSMIVPLIWAGFVVWALTDRKILRPVIGMGSALVASGAAIAWALLA
jgi:hypothetical protein